LANLSHLEGLGLSHNHLQRKLDDGLRVIHSDSMDKSSPFVYRTSLTGIPSIICLTPKSGSTTLKLALAKGLNIPRYPDSDGVFRIVGDIKLPYNISTAEWTSILHNCSMSEPFCPNAKRYMIVRHPASRLLSGYLDQVIAKKLSHRWPPGFKVSSGFSGFVQAVVKARQLDTHFRLQSKQCGIAQGMRYQYLRLEEYDEWYREFVCSLSIEKAVRTGWEHVKSKPGISSSCFHEMRESGCEVNCSEALHKPRVVHRRLEAIPTDANSKLADYYTKELADLVNSWAMADLQEFGYEPLRIPPVSSILRRVG
jgi:hypothetical protein